MHDPNYTIWIGLGWHPPRKNVYNSGATIRARAGRRKRMRRHTADVLACYKIQAKIPNAEGKRRIQVTLVMEKGQRAGDPDGYQECLLDSMQDACLIRNDNHLLCEMERPIIVRVGQWKDEAKIHKWDEAGTRIDLWDL